MWADAERDGRPPSESFVIPFLVPRRKVRLTPTARLPCSNAANIGERETWTQNESRYVTEAPKMYNSIPAQERAKHRVKVWLTSVDRRRCGNEAKT